MDGAAEMHRDELEFFVGKYRLDDPEKFKLDKFAKKYFVCAANSASRTIRSHNQRPNIQRRMPPEVPDALLSNLESYHYAKPVIE